MIPEVVSRVDTRCGGLCRSLSASFFLVRRRTFMNSQLAQIDLERWTRVKARLRAEVGEDVFSSWFTRMELEGIEEDTVRLSVPTRFLRSWIQSHYAEK